MNNILHTTTLSVGKPTTHHPHGDDDVRVVAVEEEGHSSCLLLGHVKPVGTTNTESSCHKRCPSAAASSLAGPAAMERVLRDIPRESHRGLPLTLALTEVGEALRAKRDKSRRRHDEWTSKACEATRNAMSRIESARLESDASTLRHDRLLREKYADDQVERFQRASERDDRLRRAQLKRADIVHRGEVNHLHEHRHEDEEEKEEEQKNTKKKMKQESLPAAASAFDVERDRLHQMTHRQWGMHLLNCARKDTCLSTPSTTNDHRHRHLHHNSEAHTALANDLASALRLAEQEWLSTSSAANASRPAVRIPPATEVVASSFALRLALQGERENVAVKRIQNMRDQDNEVRLDIAEHNTKHQQDVLRRATAKGSERLSTSLNRLKQWKLKSGTHRPNTASSPSSTVLQRVEQHVCKAQRIEQERVERQEAAAQDDSCRFLRRLFRL